MQKRVLYCWWYTLGVNPWYISGVNAWYIIARKLTTDVTRMSGRSVCIAGYVGKGWDSLECVRPVLPRPAHTEEDFLL